MSDDDVTTNDRRVKFCNQVKTSDLLKNWPRPSDLSSSDYDDLLGERRGKSDLRWAAQEWASSGGYRGGRTVAHDEAVAIVLQSKRVREAIQRISEAEGKSTKHLQKEVTSILKTMGHTSDISAVRKFAFTLPKIMKIICKKILVYRPGIERLRLVMQEHPVVLLPTHRSYADFLLISYLTFHYKLPSPIIAAGMDFIHMAYIGSLFREAGAFYMKRSFMEDDLYWAVFQEYVQVLVCYEAAPMEFFLEGTRSRTGKSLRPKLGLLGCVAQCCWRGHTKEVLLAPVNISYSRLLEEELYAYELLGVPKPKESTSGLFRAKKILDECYGNIYIHLGQPMSVLSVMGPKFVVGDGAVMDVAPLSPFELGSVDRLALRVVREQQNMAVLSSFSCAAHYLLRVVQRQQESLEYSVLLEGVRNLLYCLGRPTSGAQDWMLWDGQADGGDVDKSLRDNIALHHNIVTLDSDDKLHFAEFACGTSPTSAAAVGSHSVLHLMLQHYANQSMHLLVRPSLLVLAVTAQDACDKARGRWRDLPRKEDQQDKKLHFVEESTVRERFFKLCSLFSQEFTFNKEEEEQDYEVAVQRLQQCGGLERARDGLRLYRVEESSPTMVVYSTCLRPFLLTHSAALNVAPIQEWGSEAALVSRIQQSVKESLSGSSRPRINSAMSLDSVRNAVRAVTKCGGLRSVRTNGSGSPSKLVPCEAVLQELMSLLTGECSAAALLDGGLRAKL